MDKLLLKLLSSKNFNLTAVYQFTKNKYKKVGEVRKKVKGEFYISLVNLKWDKGIKITKKEFKKLNKYLTITNISVLPKNENEEILFIDYEFNSLTK